MHCNERDVSDVDCKAHGWGWSCSYSSRDGAGVLTLEDRDHPEISVIC